MLVRLEARRGRASIATISAACGIALGLAGGRAHAQGATAQQRFDDGDRWLAEGRLDEACAAFEESNRLDARAGTLIRLGECRERNDQLASAAAAYRDALARVKDPRKRAYAQQQLTALERRLSYLTVVVADDHRLDGLAINCDDRPLDAALWNQPQPIDGGDHVIAAQADGHEAWRTTVHVPVDRGQIRVELPRLAELARPEPAPRERVVAPPEPIVAPSSPVTQPPPELPQGDRDAPSPSRFTTRRKVGVGVAVVGAGAAVVGAILGAAAKGKQKDALALCPDGPACQRADAANALIRSGHHQALEANIALGVAAAAAIGAGALWFTGAPAAESPRRVTLVPVLAPGWAGLAVAGRL